MAKKIKDKKTQDKINKYAAMLSQQLADGIIPLMDGEGIVQCDDIMSFDGAYFYPECACTNLGRIWSIRDHKWKAVFDDGNWHNYWRVGLFDEEAGNARLVYVHLIIACYWGDKTVLSTYLGSAYEVHHIKSYGVIPARMRHASPEARLADCMMRNRADNLQYILKSDHKKFVHHIKDDDDVDYNLALGESDGIPSVLGDPDIPADPIHQIVRLCNGIEIAYHEDGTKELRFVIRSVH